jgi:hypothetical protein
LPRKKRPPFLFLPRNFPASSNLVLQQRDLLYELTVSVGKELRYFA